MPYFYFIKIEIVYFFYILYNNHKIDHHHIYTKKNQGCTRAPQFFFLQGGHIY